MLIEVPRTHSSMDLGSKSCPDFPQEEKETRTKMAIRAINDGMFLCDLINTLYH
jgi:hypothetical protein